MNTSAKRQLTMLIAAGFLAGTNSNAAAELVDRGGGMIFDTVLNVTWLQDANYAYTSGYSTANGGRMTWQEAKRWAAQLDYGGFKDWRLPTVSPANGKYFVFGDLPSHPSNSYSGLTDLGFNVASPQSELGYMFYVNLRNTGSYDTAGNYLPYYDSVNTGPFSNLQHYFYWSETTYKYDKDNFPATPTFCAPPLHCTAHGISLLVMGIRPSTTNQTYFMDGQYGTAMFFPEQENRKAAPMRRAPLHPIHGIQEVAAADRDLLSID